MASLERIAELRPADWQLRFKLAYKHSQCENNDMALHHYSKIPPLHRDSTTWNNIGVSLSYFDMPVKSNSAFKRAERDGDTLAMSNLGFRLLRAGFVDEATELAKKAITLGTYHASVPDLLKRLKEAPEEEGRREVEALEKVKPRASFFRQLGNAALAETPSVIGEQWMAPETVLAASLDGMDVRIWGSFEQDANMGVAVGMLSRKVVRRIEYTLTLRGNLLIGEVKRTTDGETSLSILALGMDKRKIMMYFEPDRTVLHVMEGSSFYDLRRVS